MRFALLYAPLLLCSLFGYAQHSFQKLDVNQKGPSNADHFTSFKGKTYFVAEDSVHGRELWWTDGISFGMVADIRPGGASAFDGWCSWCYDGEFVVAANKLFFVVKDSMFGETLYEYDGVHPPRSAVKDEDTVRSGGHLTELNGRIYFVCYLGNDKTGLYSYNPFNREIKLCAQKDFYGLALLQGKLISTALNTSTGAYDLYIYDPITEQLVTAPQPNTGYAFDAPRNFYVYKNILFFLLYSSGAHGNELYRFDGTTPPRKITDMAPNQANSFPMWEHSAMVGDGNKLYFMASDGPPMHLLDLYSYDVVTDSIVKLKEMDSYRAAGDMAMYGRKLYFASDSSYNMAEGLYVYDGNSVNTFPYPAQSYSEKPFELTESYGKLYFTENENYTWYAKEVYVYVDSIALGINDVKVTIVTALYPNPATSTVYMNLMLKNAASLAVRLTDIQGRIVYATEARQYPSGKHEIKMPVQGLAAGNYIYTIMSDSGEILGRGKLVKE